MLALPQGAIDRTMDEQPAGLLAKLLELTGERALLDEVEAQRERAGEARGAYLEAVEAARAEQDALGALASQAASHLEWAGLRERLDLLRDLARPAAEHRDVAVRVEAARAEREAVAERIAADRRDLDELTGQLPTLEARTTALADQAGELAEGLAGTRDTRAALEVRLAATEARAEEAQRTAVRLAGLAGERTTEQAASEVQAAESSLAAVLARREELRATLAGVQAGMAVLAQGGVPVPAEVEAFRERLAEAGIQASVVAEVLELADEAAGDAARVRAEAALGDALWALLVPSHAYRQATALAVEAGYRWGIARGGAGDPRAALTAVLGPVEAGLLLERADAQAAHDAAQAHGLAGRGLAAVAPDGMRYGDALARLEAPAQPVLGRRARELHHFGLKTEAARLGEELTAVDAAIAELRGAWQRAMHVLDAVHRLDDLQGQVEEAERRRERAGVDRPELVERERTGTGELRELDGALGAASAELALAGSARTRSRSGWPPGCPSWPSGTGSWPGWRPSWPGAPWPPSSGPCWTPATCPAPSRCCATSSGWAVRSRTRSDSRTRSATPNWSPAANARPRPSRRPTSSPSGASTSWTSSWSGSRRPGAGSRKGSGKSSSASAASSPRSARRPAPRASCGCWPATGPRSTGSTCWSPTGPPSAAAPTGTRPTPAASGPPSPSCCCWPPWARPRPPTCSSWTSTSPTWTRPTSTTWPP